MSSRLTLTLLAGMLGATSIGSPALAQGSVDEGLYGGARPYALENVQPLPGEAARGRAKRETTPSEQEVRPPDPGGCPYRKRKLELIV